MEPRPFAFGPFIFDGTTATLLRNGTPVQLGGRGAALLASLLDADGDIVTKGELMDKAWPGAFVEEGNLAVQIAALRKTLGPRTDGGEWIVTVARVGYRLVREFSQLETLATASRRPSLAVLPFINMSSDREQDFFADGIVEDLITAFSRFTSFSVIARHSSFVYKDKAFDVRDAARALGVRYLLEGSVRRTGQRVRVSAQLIEGDTGRHLWAEKLDGRLEDVFDFQDRVTERVVGIIEPQIRRAEIDRARRKRPESLDAYDLYLQALPLMQSPDVAGYGEAIELFERAIALDPHYAPTLALAAWAHEKRLSRGGIAPAGVDDAAEAVALGDRALAADGDDALVVVIAGVILTTIKGDTEAGFLLIRRALTLNPNNVLILNIAGFVYWQRGEFDEAIACNLRSLLLSPGAPEQFWSLSGIARTQLSAGRPEAALTWGLRSLESYDALDITHAIVAASYVHLDRMEEARMAVARALALWPEMTVRGLLGRNGGIEPHDRLLGEGLAKAGLPEA